MIIITVKEIIIKIISQIQLSIKLLRPFFFFSYQKFIVLIYYTKEIVLVKKGGERGQRFAILECKLNLKQKIPIKPC